MQTESFRKDANFGQIVLVKVGWYTCRCMQAGQASVIKDVYLKVRLLHNILMLTKKNEHLN